jgi:nucleoside-diphosphate-sugar epimerase
VGYDQKNERKDTMRVFVAGASGVLGRRLVPQLIDAGHEVIGTHSSPASAELLRTLGAKPVMLDLLDTDAVSKAVLESEPEAIVHQATALANVKFSRSLDKSFTKTNELRTKGTDALLAAARKASVPRFVAQSFASYRYAREGGPIKTEDDPLDPAPPPNTQESWAALAHLERVVTDFGGSLCATAASTALPTTAGARSYAGAGCRSLATAAASSPGSTSTTPPPQPYWRWNTRGPPSTTSSTTSPRRYANGCPRLPRP